MELRIFTEPQQGAAYDDLLAVARRAESLGFGSGWYEAEHTAYGIPFPSMKERFDRLADGHGKVRTLQLAARHADECSLPFAGVDDSRVQFDRDPATMTLSTALVVCCGRTEPEIAARAAAIGREVPQFRENGLVGTPAEVIAGTERYAATGASRIYLQVLDLADLEHLDLIAAEVLPAVA